MGNFRNKVDKSLMLHIFKAFAMTTMVYKKLTPIKMHTQTNE